MNAYACMDNLRHRQERFDGFGFWWTFLRLENLLRFCTSWHSQAGGDIISDTIDWYLLTVFLFE